MQLTLQASLIKERLADYLAESYIICCLSLAVWVTLQAEMLWNPTAQKRIIEDLCLGYIFTKDSKQQLFESKM